MIKVTYWAITGYKYCHSGHWFWKKEWVEPVLVVRTKNVKGIGDIPVGDFYKLISMETDKVIELE